MHIPPIKVEMARVTGKKGFKSTPKQEYSSLGRVSSSSESDLSSAGASFSAVKVGGCFDVSRVGRSAKSGGCIGAWTGWYIAVPGARREVVASLSQQEA